MGSFTLALYSDPILVSYNYATHNQSGGKMSKFLFRTKYTQAGVSGLLKEGGTRRKEALRKTIEGVGGTLEGFYYAFGDDDLLLIADLPDAESAMAISMFISAAGALKVTTTVLVAPETIDGAVNKNVTYRTPGS